MSDHQHVWTVERRDENLDCIRTLDRCACGARRRGCYAKRLHEDGGEAWGPVGTWTHSVLEPDLSAPPGFSPTDLVECVKREIRMRERVYPAWVARGRLSQPKAHAEISLMKAVLQVVEQLPGAQPVPEAQASLFAEGSRR